MTSTGVTTSPATLLAGPVPARVHAGPEHWGFGGVHGGLAVALLTGAMRSHAPGASLRSVTAQFHSPVRHEMQLHTEAGRSGRTKSAVQGHIATDDGIHVTASALFSASDPARRPAIEPGAPPAPPPGECDVFTIPAELVPFAQHTEIRPVGPNRPFQGGSEAELTAWIRLVSDDEPPDARRLVVLMDALAPSYAAVMTEFVPIPTVELGVRPSPGLGRATSPWVLLHARTHRAGGGWIDEHLDAWGPDGAHLGSAQQLRFVVESPQPN